ncbi:MAG: hypothetical protein R2695_20885 [Acidimicrobiales bacterium]
MLARLAGRALSTREVQRTWPARWWCHEAAVDVPWQWNQSLMELSALVCARRSARVVPRARWPIDAAGEERADPAERTAGGPRPRAGSRDRTVSCGAGWSRRCGQARSTKPALVGDPGCGGGRRVLAGLIADGLVEQVGSRVALVGDRVGRDASGFSPDR